MAQRIRHGSNLLGEHAQQGSKPRESSRAGNILFTHERKKPKCKREKLL